MPSEPQKSRVQAPAAQTMARRRYAARGRLDSTHGRAAQDPGAVALGATRNRGDRARGLRTAVASSVQRARPALAAHENPPELAAGDEARVERVIMRDGKPFAELLELRAVFRKVQRAALVEANVLTELAGQILPESKALHHERQLDRGPALLPHPAPVAPRLLAGDPALLEQHHGQSGAREIVGRRAADDAAADDHDVGCIRQRLAGLVAGELVRGLAPDLLLAAHDLC
jgi:hypothetical protein